MRWVLGGSAGDPVELMAAYAMPQHPLVRANFATSVDGAVEVSGRSRGVSSDADREIFHILRIHCDVVLVGAQTVRAEGYGPSRAADERQALRVELGYAPVPPIAVVTRSAGLDPASPLFSEARARTLVLVPSATSENADHLRQVADVIVCGEYSVEPALALAALAERGHTRVLTEGGPHLNHDLMAAGCLDELCLTISPLLAGDSHQHLAAAPLSPQVPFELQHAIEHEGSLFLRYGRPSR